jgi:2,4-dienoyl-CoA reductase-like NADH-dependent reductase (Old Yellow Enzyme family)
LFTPFLKTLTSRRTGEYGGAFENRIRFGLETVAAVRARELGVSWSRQRGISG